MRLRTALLATVMILSCLSCSGPVVTAVGESNDLIVMHDGRATDRAAAAAVALMESEVSWLLGEPAFSTTLTTPSEARDLANRRQILLIGTWTGGEVERVVRRRMPGLEPGGPPRLHVDRDVWAKGQFVGTIMARDEAELLAFLGRGGRDLVVAYENAAVERAVDKLRSDGRREGVEAALADRFGWSIAPPTGYEFFTTHADRGFVFFRRTRPDRNIFISWFDAEGVQLTGDFVVAKREELTGQYYDGDVIERRRPFEIESVEFAGHEALRVSGWWGNRELVGGGPFRTYCFHEPSRRRIYMVDASLFAPALDKTSLMRNLDAFARTFAVHAPRP